ncbi:class I SAM-dependent methyltransferase [Actinomadura sp. HBU206391]|uniref:class I SAM-dependent methyltransferase n=1 Tax=Actinomadura sp. HBU206391 TaxID=2731692 RepID=UPI00164F31D1|nr:class I SAM-dependent methyltransferase [Actinomadura sp. HBU206391]MBC6456628.1 class I SAM-dependent methyltransferase [Actinomadura sp. HBU206391]
MAGEYADATDEYGNFPGLRDEVLTFEKMLPLGLPVLDLGCGGGRDSRLLADLGRQTVAADFGMSMLQCARSRSSSQARDLHFVRLDLLELPFPADRFGGVWASGSLLHLPSAAITRALSEIFRTLAPGGGVAAISMRAGAGEGWRVGGTLAGRRWFTLVDPGDFASQMKRVGFRRVRIRDTGRKDWFVAIGQK